MDALVDDWLAAQRSSLTRGTYGHGMREFRGWCDRAGVDVLAATRGDIDRYRGWLKSLSRPGGALSDPTLAVRLSILASFYKYVLEERSDLIDHSPMERVKRPTVSNESQRDGLSLEQARALLGASIESCPRDAALVHVLLMTGARVSEVCRAKASDIRLVNGSRRLYIVRKGGKADRVLLPPACWRVVDGYLQSREEGPEGPLLVTQRGAMSRQTAYEIVAKLGRGVVSEQRVGPHTLRHAAATLALNDGMELQEVQMMLGHANPATTLRYDRARSGRGEKAGRALGALLDMGTREGE